MFGFFSNFSNTKSLKNPTNEFSYDNYPVKLQLAISAHKYFWEEENAGDQRTNSDVEAWLHKEAINLKITHNDGKPMFRDIEPIPPPELIIQDELHLISGTLGTLTGLYETVIDDLCLHNGIKPKIIASTATIKNSDNQIKWLFARSNTKIFPPQAFKFGETYFSNHKDII